MDRLIRRDISSYAMMDDDDDDYDEEEKLYEKQALMDDQKLRNDNEMRHRQSIRTISANDNYDNNNYELKAINSNSKFKDLFSEPIVEFTFYDIQPGDSLQSICLRYACSVNQVKRLNGLISDQDFYGLRRIKLPLGKLGLLEDVLKSQRSPEASDCSRTADSSPVKSRFINSPGTAQCVSQQRNPSFKPLLSPGYSSDAISDFKSESTSIRRPNILHQNGNNSFQHNHSYSLTSLRELDNIKLNIEPAGGRDSAHDKIQQKTFIKPELDSGFQPETVDDILGMEFDNKHIDRVFQDLDYQVERAKAAAEYYDEKAAELNDRIGENGGYRQERARVSRIPELFSCNENFGLSYKKLIIFIVVVCLVAPLLLIKQRDGSA